MRFFWPDNPESVLIPGSFRLPNGPLAFALVALGLLPTGLPAAISAVFPEAEIRTCVVQLMRNSLSFCSWKQRHPVARELKRIYQAESADLAAKRLEEFAEGPGVTSSQPSSRAEPGLGTSHPVFAYSKAIRKIICTTNPIESLHMQLRKVLKNRGHFPSDEASREATKT